MLSPILQFLFTAQHYWQKTDIFFCVCVCVLHVSYVEFTPLNSPHQCLRRCEKKATKETLLDQGFRQIVIGKLSPLFLVFSLWKIIKDNLHKAFWDTLESELNDDPPEYGQAIRLLEEIREVSTHILMFAASLNSRL